ncbi:ATP-binding protein [Gemmatimonas sp.]|uniref:ATP-binding protein n=1 Tax=Gemmatimonas sp. TaxID=1962908 RepID=UPI003340B859
MPPLQQAQRSRHGIGTKLRRVAVFVALVFLAVAYVRARERQLAEQNRLGERAQDNAATIARSLDAVMLQAQILLQSVAYVVNPLAAPESNDAVLQSLFAKTPKGTFANLYVVDTLGRNIGAGVVPVGGRKTINLLKRAYFQAALRSKRFTVGTPVPSQTLAGAPWVVPFILPVVDSTTGRIVALTGASMRVDSLDAVRIARRLPPLSVLTVLDSTGMVLIRTLDANNWIGKMFPNYPQRAVNLQPLGSDTVVPSDIDRIDRLFGTDSVRRVRWRVYVGIPISEVFGPSRRQFIQDMLLGLILSASVVLIGYWLTERFVAPIESLTLDARAISAGDMTRRSTLNSDDEVGTLARAFNQMADDIVERNTELATSQEHLRQVQKLEALGTFAGGIAHDFNNYLSSIIGHADLAMEELDVNSTARLELASMLTSAHRAADLTKQILVFSRRQVVTPIDIDVNATLRSMQRLLVRLLGENIAFRTEFASRLGSVHIDQGQFEQIIVNLTANARDAMPRGGRFVLRTSRCTVDGIDFIRIDAEDSGDGVPPELRTRIFEPFFTKKDRSHGTGLGLSIVHGILGAAGGSVEVDERHTDGARFTVLLPEGPPVEAPAPVAGLVPPQGHAERILLVDDDAGVLLVAERLLRRGGYQVETAPDGAHALQQLAQASFDLLISDVVMPGLSGPQLVQEAMNRHGAMRVLFISGYPDDDLLPYEVASMHAGFLGKPFTRDSLLRKVREMLEAPVA